MDDRELVSLYLARSEEAIRQTQLRYGSFCAAIAYRILGSIDDAEECANDTLLRAWDSIPPAQPENLGAYLGKITRNLALMRKRAAQRQKRGGGNVELALSELGEIVGGHSPETELAKKELCESIDRFLATLPQEKRVIFVLRYWYLYSTAEIARKIGCREGSVSSILSRLRKQLKTHLEQEGFQL